MAKQKNNKKILTFSGIAAAVVLITIIVTNSLGKSIEDKDDRQTLTTEECDTIDFSKLPSYEYVNGKPRLTLTHYGDVDVVSFLEIADDAYIQTPRTDKDEYYHKTSTPYWLMNRIIQMYAQVGGAEKIWAWKCAVDESIAAYNRFVGRPVDSPAAKDSTMQELLHYVNYFENGSTSEITLASYLTGIINLYQTIKIYDRMLDSISDSQFKQLLFDEYCAWETFLTYYWDYLSEPDPEKDYYSSQSMELNYFFTERIMYFQKLITRDYNVLVLNHNYVAQTHNSLKKLQVQYEEARVPIDSTNIATFLPFYFDKWLDARKKVNDALQGTQAKSYSEATRDIIEGYLHPVYDYDFINSHI
jgi:hypothetical protein